MESPHSATPWGHGNFGREIAETKPVPEENWDPNVLPPGIDESFIRLEGNILTGSAAWNWSGTAGSPAVVGTRQSTRAEFFADGTVRGTITQHQRTRDGGPQEHTLEFSFEATRVQ